MKIRSDGSVQSSNVPTWDNVTPRTDYGLYKCMITDVIYTDDLNNLTSNSKNKEMLYHVVILGGPSAGQTISNCRLSSDLGGNNNYWERVLKASTKVLTKDELSTHDGDIVFIQFTQGHSGYPIITCLDGGIDTSESIGATREEGPRSKRQYNGIFEKISKLGEYTFIRHGGTFTDPEFIPSSDISYSWKALKNEVIEEEFLTGLVNKTDGKADLHTRTYGGGLKHTEDGKADLNEIKTSAGALLKLAKAKVALGAGNTEILDEVSKALGKIITWATSVGKVHTHVGNLGYSTGIPIQTAGYETLASDLQTIKDAIDAIKGTL